MEVKRSQARHIPDNFRQHTESDDDLQVRFQSPQLGKKSLIFQFSGWSTGNSFDTAYCFTGLACKTLP